MDDAVGFQMAVISRFCSPVKKHFYRFIYWTTVANVIQFWESQQTNDAL